MRLLLSILIWLSSAKTLFSLRVAVVLTPVLVFVEKYLFKDWHFLGSLCVLIMVDTVFGVQHHWRAHSISSRAFSRLFTKCGIYLGLLVLTHQMTTYQVDGKPNGIFTWFDSFMYAAMMAREAVSILEHMDGLVPGLIPQVLRKRLALVADGGPEALTALTPSPEATPSEATTNPTAE